jgi:hypothetical protein
MTYDTIHPWQDRNDPVSTRQPITFNPEQRRHAPFRFPGDTAMPPHSTQQKGVDEASIGRFLGVLEGGRGRGCCMMARDVRQQD